MIPKPQTTLIKKSFGTVLKEEREKAGKTPQELADHLRIPLQAVEKMEANAPDAPPQPPLPVLIQIAKFFGIGVFAILPRHEEVLAAESPKNVFFQMTPWLAGLLSFVQEYISRPPSPYKIVNVVQPQAEDLLTYLDDEERTPKDAEIIAYAKHKAGLMAEQLVNGKCGEDIITMASQAAGPAPLLSGALAREIEQVPTLLEEVARLGTAGGMVGEELRAWFAKHRDPNDA